MVREGNDMGAEIVARFVSDGNGRPAFIEKGGRKSYAIELRVEEAPEDTYAVTYILHESYYDNIRELRNAKDSFAERLTSYGDYTVQAKLRRKHRVDLLASELSAALARGHRGDNPEAFQAALDDIRRN